MFRARKLTMLEQALSDVGIDIYFGPGRDVIDNVVKYGNLGNYETENLIESMSVVLDGNDLRELEGFTIWAKLNDKSYNCGNGSAWIVKITNSGPTNIDKISVNGWIIQVWDFKSWDSINEIIYSEYDLTGKKLSSV